MTGTIVCTDSSALLAHADVARLGIEVVPIPIAIDGERAHADLDVDDFYARMSAGVQVSTSQPSPGQLGAVYAGVAARGATSAISIHLDARVSGTAAAAELAAGEATIPVTVVAAETVSFGVGICARAAADALADGASPDAAAERARRLGVTLRNVFVAPGAPSGRASAPTAWAVASFQDGSTRALAACATPDEAVEAMVELMLADAGAGAIRAAVGHASAAVEPAADTLAAALAGAPLVRELERYRVGPAVGAHTGPSSFGTFWWPADA